MRVNIETVCAVLADLAWDITERKRGEEALQAASSYNRSLIEASLDPLVTISAEGKITDVNTATERVTGYSRQNSSGQISLITSLILKKPGLDINKPSKMAQ